jgi:hypothetical protein
MQKLSGPNIQASQGQVLNATKMSNVSKQQMHSANALAAIMVAQ